MANHFDVLNAAWDTARAAARTSPSPETRAAAKAAWMALAAASPRQQTGGDGGGRAGRRQHQARLAEARAAGWTR